MLEAAFVALIASALDIFVEVAKACIKRKLGRKQLPEPLETPAKEVSQYGPKTFDVA